METKGNYLKTRTKKQSETEDIMYPLLFLSPRIPHIKGIEKTINSEVGKQRDCKSEMHFWKMILYRMWVHGLTKQHIPALVN